MSRDFEITREVDLPAAPDDVWVAITADTAAWQFPTGMEIPAGAEPPEGAPVTTWDPPHRLVIRMESPDGTFNALDYAIEARDGGTAHLRYVHSGILADEWEDQYDAIGGHTDFYLHTLGAVPRALQRPPGHLRRPAVGRHRGARGRRQAPTRWTRCAPPWASRPDAGVGDEVHASLGAAGSLDGVIDYSTPEFLGVRTDDGLYRFFGRNHYGGVVGMSAHLFVGRRRRRRARGRAEGLAGRRVRVGPDANMCSCRVRPRSSTPTSTRSTPRSSSVTTRALRGKPVIVGMGVVLAASYEAKRRGVKTAMGGHRALRLCPEAIVVPPRMTAYTEASRAVFEVFDDTSPQVEPLSIDEAFLDARGMERIAGTPEQIARRLRREVRERVGLPITVGVARTKFLAKVASAQAKPDGLLVVPPDGELAFLHPLPIEALWGVGAGDGRADAARRDRDGRRGRASSTSCR